MLFALGETGVGKSTVINGFGNYLMHRKLEDAEASEPIFMISSSYTMTDENYQMKTIKMEATRNDLNDSNENTAAGESATQEPQSYVFYHNNKLVRLIDTPGIGDTRGYSQDRINFQKTMTFISRFTKLNGICILLKPNNARLTVMFEFCVLELLAHLHKDACKNICFIFTNTRGTFYAPGDSLPPLQELLKRHKNIPIPLTRETMYCVDNEAIRFLAAVKNGVVFDEEKKKSFSKSWDISVSEIELLMSYIESLEPHITQGTLSLNEVRRLILEFTEPITEITKNIEENIRLAQAHKDLLNVENLSRKELISKLYVPTEVLEFRPLTQHRTICTSLKCIEVVGTVTRYKTWCHPVCHLPETDLEMRPSPAIQNCSAFHSNDEKKRGVICR